MSLSAQSSAEAPAAHLDLLAYAPCALKHFFREGLDATVEEYSRKTGQKLQWFSPLGYGQNEDVYDSLWQTEEAKQLPDIIAAVGFGNYFRKPFIEHFVATGTFQNVCRYREDSLISRAGIPDPEGCYSIYGLIPFLLLIDTVSLGDLPIPRRWEDLCNPIYKGQITLSGGNIENVADLPLLYIYKDLGDEGLKRLAENVRNVCVPAELARTAGRPGTAGTAVNVMPMVFASCCLKTDETYLLWPEDGALASPIFLLAKKDRGQNSAPFIEYITGKAMAEYMVQSRFVVSHPEVENALPPEASFKWLGWDYIRAHNLPDVTEHVHQTFVSCWKELHTEA